MTTHTLERPPGKRGLSGPRRQLLETMQRMNFGRIRFLRVHGGEPAFTAATRIERQVRFGGDNRPRPELGLEDFALKDKVRELFAAIETMGEGTIALLEVKGGLPFAMTLEERAL